VGNVLPSFVTKFQIDLFKCRRLLKDGRFSMFHLKSPYLFLTRYLKGKRSHPLQQCARLMEDGPACSMQSRRNQAACLLVHEWAAVTAPSISSQGGTLLPGSRRRCLALHPSFLLRTCCRESPYSASRSGSKQAQQTQPAQQEQQTQQAAEQAQRA